MLKRTMVLAVAVIGLAAAPVAAQEGDDTQYPPGERMIAASDTTPCPGGTTTITGTGFEPGSTVTLTLDDTTELGTPTVDENGEFAVEVTVPETTATGQHTVKATGLGDGATISATLNVIDCEAPPPTTAPPAAGGDLPRTGSDSTMTLLRIGLGLAAFGAVLLAVAAKRRRRAAALA